MNDKENKNPNDLNKADTKQKKKDNGKNEKRHLIHKKNHQVILKE